MGSVNVEPQGRDTKDESRHRGRSLDASRDDALRAAALALLAEVGYDRLSLEAVAARARAGKTTIYRRWPGKAELVVDALVSAKGTFAVPDTGSLAGDLKAVARAIVSPESRFDARVMVGMITTLARDAELREVFRARFVEPRMAEIREVLERALARGEITGDRDLDLLARLFPALALQDLVLNGEVPDAERAERIMTNIVLPLATAPSEAARAAGLGDGSDH